jgi:hypothetical protein
VDVYFCLNTRLIVPHDFCKDADTVTYIRAQDSPGFGLVTPIVTKPNSVRAVYLTLGCKVIYISKRNRVFTGDRCRRGRGKKKQLPDSLYNI